MNDSPYIAPEFQDDGASDLAPEHIATIRATQIVTVGLMVGACMFLGIALVTNNGELGTDPESLSWIAIGFAAMHLVVPSVMRRKQLASINVSDFEKRISTDQLMELLGIHRGSHIVASALLEGAAFFNLIAYMVTKFVGNLGVAVLLIVAIATRFPSQSRVTCWLTDARHELGLR